MVSLLYKFFHACCKSGAHFMSILKTVHSSAGSHDKVIYIIFCYAFKSNQICKLKYIVEPGISSLVLILCLACKSYLGYMAVMMMV